MEGECDHEMWDSASEVRRMWPRDVRFSLESYLSEDLLIPRWNSGENAAEPIYWIAEFAQGPLRRILPSLSANVVIPRLNMIFARQGYSTIVKPTMTLRFRGKISKTLPPIQVLGTEGLHLWPVADPTQPRPVSNQWPDLSQIALSELISESHNQFF